MRLRKSWWKTLCCNLSLYSFTLIKKSYPGCPNYAKVVVILSRTALEEDASCLKYLRVICRETPSNWISVDANALLQFHLVNWYQSSLRLILETSGNGSEMQCCCSWPRDICFVWNKFLWKTLSVFLKLYERGLVLTTPSNSSFFMFNNIFWLVQESYCIWAQISYGLLLVKINAPKKMKIKMK